jgi:ABC-type multidrug transport system permease subunit
MEVVSQCADLLLSASSSIVASSAGGLDAPAAWRVMTAIKRIALTGRTCIATIHQPSARLFYLFDRLLLLQPGGETIYNHAIGGRGEQLISYLEAASGFKLQLPEDTNPADFALGLRTDPNARGTQEGDWAYKWTHSRLNQTQVVPLIEKYTNVATFKGEAAALSSKDGVEFASWTQRYWAVQKRLFVSYWRNSPMNLTRTVIAIVIGFLIGLTYYGVQPNSFAGVNSFLAGTFMAVLFGPSLSSIAALPTMFRQRPVFYRECTVRMYDVAVYQLTLTVAELFSLAALMVLYTVPHYWLMGLNASGYQFFRFLLIVFLMAQVYASLSQAYLAFLPNQVAAAVVHAILFAFFFVFGGLLITAKAYPIGFKWFYYMLPTPKAYIALALGQLSCSDSPALAGGFGCGTITTPNTSDQPVQVYEYVSTQLENSAESYGNQVGWMILIIVVIKIATAMGFKWISHLKR